METSHRGGAKDSVQGCAGSMLRWKPPAGVARQRSHQDFDVWQDIWWVVFWAHHRRSELLWDAYQSRENCCAT